MKHQANDVLFIDNEETHILQLFYDLRGVDEDASGDTLVLEIPGDISRSSVEGNPLVDIFNGNINAAVNYHKKLAGVMNKDVISQSDPMASRPALRMCKLGDLLLQVGATSAAWYCGLMNELLCISTGVNTAGNRVSFEVNVQQGEIFLAKIEAWRSQCLELCQELRGGTRYRGFMTEELYHSLQVTISSSSSLHRLFMANDELFLKRSNVRSTIPQSFINETTHATLRAISPQVHIAECARTVGNLMCVTKILADPARTYVRGWGQGGQQSYQGSADSDPILRNRAIGRVRESGIWAYDHKIEKGVKLTEEVKAEMKKQEEYLKNISVATNTKVVHFTGTFRQALQADHLSKYTPNMQRRSFFAQALESPGKLVDVNSKNRARTFGAKEIILVMNGRASILNCKLGGATGWIIPLPNRMSLEVRVRESDGKTSSYMVGLRAVLSVVMELVPGARVADTNAIVAVTFFFVVRGEIQLLSVVPRKGDRGVCKMLVNLKALQVQFLASASVGGGMISREVEVVTSWYLEATTGRGTWTTGTAAQGRLSLLVLNLKLK